MIKISLNGLNPASFKVLKKIGTICDRKGIQGFIVGGTVRDLILGRPNIDLDFVFEADAIQLTREMAKQLSVKASYYPPFGTATLYWSKLIRVDLTSARKESYSEPGALPKVQHGNLKQDLFRRDFTINAMAVSINQRTFGQLVDFLGGYDDLKKKKVRVLHDKSFMDDPTRILRAIRFEQRFSFHIDTVTLGLLRVAMRKKNHLTVNGSRYFVEIKKMLMEEDPKKCFARLKTVNALPIIHPRFSLNLRLISLLQKNIKRLKVVSSDFSEDKELIYMMGLMESASTKVVNEVLNKFPFTKRQRIGILHLQNLNEVMAAISKSRLKNSEVYKILRPYSADLVPYIRVKSNRSLILRRIDQFLLKYKDVDLKITGRDLIKMGCAKGEAIGQILEEVLCAKIDKRISNKQAELKLAKKLLNCY